MSKINFQPYNDILLVKKLSQETKNSAGIYIPTTAKTNRYEVLSVGEDVKYCTVGDVVMIEERRIINEVKSGEEVNHIIREMDCYGKFKI